MDADHVNCSHVSMLQLHLIMASLRMLQVADATCGVMIAEQMLGS
jgi:hypothetical protein